MDDVESSYDAVALDYAERIFHELDQKPFDRAFLDQFAARVKRGDRVCEIGSGPGHIARYLHERGVDICGLDISSEMVGVARRLNPNIAFEQGNFLNMAAADNSYDAIVSFYSVLHLERDQRQIAFREIGRVLKPGGILILATHAGSDTIHTTQWWGHEVSLKAFFVDPKDIRTEIEAAGFTVEEVLERDPYAPEVEYQSRRVYVIASLPDAHIR
ncbi:MAG: class I SAM-dependent methyltransferase [Vulcanimicrobiaceae bacterium]